MQVKGFSQEVAVQGLAGGTSAKALEDKKKAFEEFEALLLGDVLKNLRGSLGGSWLGEDAGAGTDAILEMAEQQMVKVMASQDILGLVRNLERSL